MFLLISCGLRQNNVIYDNLLYGSWRLDKIVCYDLDKINEIEEYSVYPAIDAQIIFDYSDFTYALSSEQCSTSATAIYRTDFDDNLSDRISFIELISGEACSIEITDSGANSVGNVEVVFDMFAPNAQNLLWELDAEKETMELDFFTTFDGSEDASGCGGEACTCIGEYSKL